MAESLSARVSALIATTVAECGVDLEGVDVQAAGRRRLIRVFVDTEAGVTLDDVAGVTRAVSTVLDDTNIMGEQAYTLEVGSPGVDRPLTRPRHWRRNIDRLVRVRVAQGEPFVGRIVTTTDEGAILAVPGETDQDPKVSVALAEVERAVIQIELNRTGRH